MELDRLLARLTRRVSHLPMGWQVTEALRKHYTARYRGAADPWVVIDDYAGALKLRLDRSAYLGGLLYWRGSQSAAELRVFRGLLRPDMVFVDVGANQGEYTLVAARHLTAGRVVAFEPVRALYDQLLANVRLNGFSQVTALNCGLLDEPGSRALYTSSDVVIHGSFNEGLASVFASDYRKDVVATVPFRVFDEVAAELGLERLDVMKVDVEGAELQVLRGAASILRRFRPTLLLEVNEEAFRTGGYGSRDLLAHLAQLGYASSLIRYDGVLVPLDEAGPPPLCNIICQWRV
jgi:FkbM family methyltransferase